MFNSKSIKIRYFMTMIANIVQMGFSFFMGIVVARALNPEGYGNIYFLLGSFLAVNELIDLGTSSAFYTFISQGRKSKRFYGYYLLWKLIQFSLVTLFIGAIFSRGLLDRIWLGHERGMIILAFLASFLSTQVWALVIHVGESVRATFTVQLWRMVLALASFLAVAVAAYLKFLTVTSFFLITIIFYALVITFLLNGLRGKIVDSEVNEDNSFSVIFGKFSHYCTPLIIYGWISFVYTFLDRWLLQNFGGAAEQGFYSISYRFSAVSLIATTSILNVFWKEVAEGQENKDLKKIQNLYGRVYRSLYFFGAVISCLLIPHSRELVLRLLGPSYEKAWLPLAIMLLYPILQSIGQINGTFFYASGRTKIYSIVGVALKVISFPVTYFLIAAPTAKIPGLGLGAVGMALKMLVLQLVMVNILSFLIAKIAKTKFDFWYQFILPGGLLMVSWTLKYFCFSLAGMGLFAGASLNISIYLIVIGLIFYKFPGLAGIRSEEISSGLVKIRSILKGENRS